MPDQFWLHSVLAFIVGSIWVSLTTFAAERFGSSQVVGFGPRDSRVSTFFATILIRGQLAWSPRLIDYV